MAMLDKRLRRMEDRVIKLIPKDQQESLTASGRAVVKPALPSAPAKPANKKRSAGDAFGGPDLDEWAKSKSTTESASRNQDAEENKLLSEGAEHLPPKEIQEHLAEVYFDYVYGQAYHLLHKPSYMRRLAAGTMPPVLTLSVCAIAARFSTHPQIRTEPAFLRGEKWAAPARIIALERYDSPSITILTCLLLLGLHEFGTCQGGRSWMLSGMGQRMAYALQLHKELERPPTVGGKRADELSAVDREIRRRTMWSCFVMDRFNSSGTDRPHFMQEDFIKIQLPIDESYFQMEVSGPTEDLWGHVPNPIPPDTGQMSDPKENQGCAAYFVRAVANWGRLVRYMNLGGKEGDSHQMWDAESDFHRLRVSVGHFKESLPESLHYTSENLQNHATQKIANQFIFLHIVVHQTVLFMNRFALPCVAGNRQPPKDMPQHFVGEAARAALDAANQISLLVKDANEHLVVAPFAGYSAFFSSTVHVHGVFSKNEKLAATAKQYLAYNIKYLGKMKKYWGMFHYVAENLKDIYRTQADAALKGGQAAKDVLTNVFQYGDWFDRYPHGVSQTDFEDPASESRKEKGADAVLGQKSELQSVEDFFATLSPVSRARKIAKKAKGGGRSAAQPAAPAQPSPSAANTNQAAATPKVDANFDANASLFPQGYLFNAYQTPDLNAMSPYGTSLNGTHNLAPNPATANLWNTMDFSDFNADGMGAFGTGMDPNNSAAWFLPFNMEPPDLGNLAGDDGVGGIFEAGTGAGYGALGFDLGLEFPQGGGDQQGGPTGQGS